MDISTPQFLSMNETDVREEILTPLLHRLGYSFGSNASIRRELNLVYPRLYLGRKNPKKDPYLRGRADYVMEVKGHARWVLEAKSPQEEIDQEAIYQAFTYANHPEVGALFFAISNGKRFLIKRTAHPPQSNPILDVEHGEFDRIAEILSPESIRKLIPTATPTGHPLAPGLGSIAKISRGSIRYTEISVENPLIKEMLIPIVDGVIERGNDDQLVASIIVQSPLASIQEFLVRSGLNRLLYVSSDKNISSSEDHPSIFRYEHAYTIPKGQKLFDASSMTQVEIPRDVDVGVNSIVHAHLREGKIIGSISNRALFESPLINEIKFSGSVEAALE